MQRVIPLLLVLAASAVVSTTNDARGEWTPWTPNPPAVTCPSHLSCRFNRECGNGTATPVYDGCRCSPQFDQNGNFEDMKCYDHAGVCGTGCFNDADCYMSGPYNGCGTCFEHRCTLPTCSASGTMACRANSDCGSVESGDCGCVKPAQDLPGFMCQKVNNYWCGTGCQRDADCASTGGSNQCTACEDGTCQLRQCGSRCTVNAECANTGCPTCLNGTCGIVPGHCGGVCNTDNDCANSNGCSECRNYSTTAGGPKTCVTGSGCGAPCNGMDDCGEYGTCNYCDPNSGFTCDAYVVGKTAGPAPGTEAYHRLVRDQRRRVAAGELKLIRGAHRLLPRRT